MNELTLNMLRRELIASGFSDQLGSPNGTMAFDEAYLRGIELADLLETLVARREKIFGSVGVVGQQTAKDGYDDVVRAIEATKAAPGSSSCPRRPKGRRRRSAG